MRRVTIDADEHAELLRRAGDAEERCARACEIGWRAAQRAEALERERDEWKSRAETAEVRCATLAEIATPEARAMRERDALGESIERALGEFSVTGDLAADVARVVRMVRAARAAVDVVDARAEVATWERG